jgi:hypothetical protein
MPSSRTSICGPAPCALPIRRHSSWLTAGAVLAALLWSRRGHADCPAPATAITWLYPDQGTEAVPPDAVFWAVSPAAVITLSVDGVPLAPLGTSGVERFQFTPAAPLREGEHQLVARAEDRVFSGFEDSPPSADGGTAVDADERSLHFEVTAAPAAGGDVGITAVEAYAVAFRGAPAHRVSPAPEDYDARCTNAATELFWTCDDTGGPSHLARVAYAYEGAPLAYLVQGGYLVPRGCASFWAPASPEAGSEQFRVAAVLPTGLAEEHVFTAPVDFPALDNGSFQSSPSACSVRSERHSTSAPLAAAALLGLAACARRRRHATPRASPARRGVDRTKHQRPSS